MAVKPPGRLGSFDVLALGLNAIVGSGIFLFPGTLAALVGPASVLAFLTCAVLLAGVALCYAELGGMFKGSGGSYLYAREAFGDEVGFGVGVLAWTAALLSWAAVASLLAGHLAYFHPVFEGRWAGRTASALVLAVLGAVNYRGIRPAAWTVDAVTVAKLLPLGVFVLLCLPRAEAARFTPFFGGEGRFGYAVFLALWALQGFEVVPVPAGEASDPQRDVPRGVLGSLGFAALLYALIQAAALGVHPALAGSSERPLVDAAQAALGPWGGRLLAAGGTLSMLGFLAGAALGEPRYLSALGERHLRRWKLDRFDEGTGVPGRAILATTGGAVVLVLLLPSMSLVDLSNLSVVSQYLATCAAALVLRRRRPEAERPYRMPWAWVAAPTGIVVSLWLMTQVGRAELTGTCLVLMAGYGLRRLVDGAWVSPRPV
ncbi:MAG: amino acid permease [Elusimicrobia bacterium]|nr:amino acid permease [Elusimicrobiota bacterium]